MKKSTILIFSFLLSQNSFAQNKPEVLPIKTSIPDNPIVSIKNDVYNPDSVIKEKESGFKDKEHLSVQTAKPKLNQINKNLFDINAVQTLIQNGTEQYLGHCVVTERTGSTAGTIWVVAGIRSNPIGNDKIGIYKFDQNGWVFQTYIYTQQYLGYSMDAEIIEKDTGEKALWIVTETTQSVLFTKWEVMYVGLNLANLFQGTAGILNWPGAGSSDQYYSPRITTDNASDQSFPWIYIVASVDSITSNGNHLNAQKFAFVDNAWSTTNPNINYRTEILPVFWPAGGTTEIHYLYSDITFLNIAGSYKLIFTYSNVPDNTRIWLSSCSNDGTNATVMGTIDGHGDYNISASAIASSGGVNQQQLMVVFEENYLNSGDWDLVSARSNDAGSTWFLNYIDGSSSTTDKIPHLGTMVSRKGVEDEYYVSYSLDNPADSIMSTKSNNGATNYWDQRVKMSEIYPPYYIFSSVGITNTPDERITVWSTEITSLNFSLIGSFWPHLPTSVEDESETSLSSYQLFQNYPNPFNPSTKISWQSPVGSLQSIKVYDVLGNEVARLINEYKPAGNYEVEFNASELSSGIYFYKLQAGEYVETKKMILLK